MSLSVGASAAGIANQLLAALYSKTNATTSATPAETPTAISTGSSANSLTGGTKLSLSDDILSTFMHLQQGQTNHTKPDAGNYRYPAQPVVGRPSASSPDVSSGQASDEMVRAMRLDTSNSTATAASITATDAADDSDSASEADSAIVQTASRAAFGI